MTSDFQQIRAWGGLHPLDRQLANMLLREVGSESTVLWLSVALLTWVTRQGDVCIDLERWANRPLGEVLAKASRDSEVGMAEGMRLPELAAWKELLVGSGLVGDDTFSFPLALKGERLYLAKHRQHEAELAARVVERLVPVGAPIASEELRQLVEHWFCDVGEPAGQAAVIAATRRFCLITGGPGTGKTSTVVRLLGLLDELSRKTNLPPPRVLLLAPTGKAAARLSESILQAQSRLAHLSGRLDGLPRTASTVHRALATCQALPDGRRRPLAADIVILDEASMVDLAMMRRLLDAAVNVERLVVLGDPYQLASVEAGAVLGELCAARVEITDHRVELTESHRFRGDGGIGLFAQYVKSGDVTGALGVLGGGDEELRFLESSERSLEPIEELIVRGNAPLLAASSPVDALARLDRFRVLCVHRKGRFGVEIWNERLRRRLGQLRGRERQPLLVEPILITENAPDAALYNGDLGIVWQEPGRARAWFGLADGTATEFGLSRLPKHESAYVMSVHKSQGSEVDEVFVLLPAAGSALLTRELLYTAVTRARKRCTLVGTRAAVEQAIARKVERHSGLGEEIAERVAGGGEQKT